MSVNVWATVGSVTGYLPMSALLGTAGQLLGMDVTATLAEWKNVTFLSSQLAVPVGSAAAPSYIFTGDVDTGPYQIAPDTYGIATAGVRRVALSATGLVSDVDVQLSSKLLKEDQGANIAAAATTDLGNATGNFLTVTNAAGATVVTSLGGATIPAGTEIETVVSITGGSVTLTHNAVSLLLLGGANQSLVHGDVLRWRKINDASAYWQQVGFQRGASTGNFTAKGDWLLGAGGAGNFLVKGIGIEGTIPRVRDAEATGVAWENTAPFPTGHLFGFTLVTNVGDPTNDLDVSTGKCRDSTDAADIIATAARTGKQLDVVWAAGNNAGLLDTGVVGNATYHIFTIKKDSDGTTDALASLSASAPTMPAGYTYFRRLGSIVRTGGANLAFSQNGDEFLLNTPVLDVNANNPGAAAVTVALASIPAGIVVNAIQNWVLNNNAAGVTAYGYISALVSTDLAPSATAAPGASGIGNAAAAAGQDAHPAMGKLLTRTNTSREIRYRLSASDANVTLCGSTLGWIDTRGRVN